MAVAIEYKEVQKLLDGVALPGRGAFLCWHHGTGVKRMSVADAVNEMTAAESGERRERCLPC